MKIALDLFRIYPSISQTGPNPLTLSLTAQTWPHLRFWTKLRKVQALSVDCKVETKALVKPRTDSLHKSRLLNVEEKPSKRITKRLLASDSLVAKQPQLPPTPPPDASAADEAAAAHEAQKQVQLDARRQWREDMLLDFAAFESSIVRIQFLLTSNIKERERYAAEKLKIEATAQAVKDNTADLRVQLLEAQKQLALRKEYDELAEKITSNRSLRPREDQRANLAKLNAEIAELERESQGYAQTWVERRQQFSKIIDEGMEMRRQIRAEKEEVDRREGMEGAEDGEEGEGSSLRGRSSGVGTPAPGHEGGATPLNDGGIQDIDPTSGGLAVGSQQMKREKSPLRISQTTEEEPEKASAVDENEDAEMAEDGEVEPEQDAVAAPPEGLMADEDEKEEGEEEDAPVEETTKEGDTMDMS